MLLSLHIFLRVLARKQVVVLACRARSSIIPGPDFGLDKHQWFSKGFKKMVKGEEDAPFLSRVYEWRLDLRNGVVAERNLTGKDCSMEFPIINDKYIGKKCKYGYTQVVDPKASSISGNNTSSFRCLSRLIEASTNKR